MIVYNITIKITPEIEKDWVAWQKSEHIPDVMASEQFTEYKFYRLLEQENDDGITYVVQYFTSSIENYNCYIDETAPLLRQKAIEKWGNKFIAFRTLMQVVN
jgi:predicted ATP-dependent endonuclease of OLD family